jgi:hypothetical protein
MALIYTLQALLGFGDGTDELKGFQDICLKGFEQVLGISSLDEIAKTRNSKTKYSYPYIESDEYFPDSYTLAMLAYSQSWRTPETMKMVVDALNHINKIMKPDSSMHVKIGRKFIAPCLALC